MEVKHSASAPASPGSAQFFTGNARVAPLFTATGPARKSCACVTFDPSARSAWHTHPLGQTLVVTAGRGFVQSWGGPVREIRPGDVIWTPPGEKHWHGAAPNSPMTHIAIQEQLNGVAVTWMEQVSDADYPAEAKRNGT
jgi:quercetin dioxygenase-like cupin family protein